MGLKTLVFVNWMKLSSLLIAVCQCIKACPVRQRFPAGPCRIHIVLDLDKASHCRHFWTEDGRQCSGHCYRWHRGWFFGWIVGRHLRIGWTFLFLLGWLIVWTISRVSWICLVGDFWWSIGWTFSGVGWIDLFRDFK